MFPWALSFGFPGWYHVLVMGVLIPALVVRNHYRIAGKSMALPNRMVHFRSTALTLSLFTALSILVARSEGIDLFQFDAGRLPQGLAAGAVMYILAVVFMRPRCADNLPSCRHC